MQIEQTIKHWHKIVEQKDPKLLNDLLAEDVVFHSPVLHTPQKGKSLCQMYLSAAIYVFSKTEFVYKKEILQDKQAMLEFEVELDGITINGADIIVCNEEAKIIEFKVMIRPLKGLEKMQEKMLKMLTKQN
jgi:hypothetical protein